MEIRKYAHVYTEIILILASNGLQLSLAMRVNYFYHFLPFRSRSIPTSGKAEAERCLESAPRIPRAVWVHARWRGSLRFAAQVAARKSCLYWYSSLSSWRARRAICPRRMPSPPLPLVDAAARSSVSRSRVCNSQRQRVPGREKTVQPFLSRSATPLRTCGRNAPRSRISHRASIRYGELVKNPCPPRTNGQSVDYDSRASRTYVAV